MGSSPGRGEYVWADGHRYVGGYRADRMHGIGTFTWPDGREYEGEFVDGRRHGQGVFTLANGDVYDGAFVANAMTGKGTYTFANGDVYEGDFVAGERTGQGVHEWSNGSRYEGGVRGGLPHGVGEYTRPDGWTYRGEYAAGARDGHGDLTWPNGNRYVGAFASDERNGFGYLRWRDGTLYRGHFAAGSPHGAGVKETPEGERFFEYWVQDNLVSSKRIEARPACHLAHAGAEWMFDGDACINGPRARRRRCRARRWRRVGGGRQGRARQAGGGRCGAADVAALNIPGYEITREIGRGGTARVYLARQSAPGREVAVKVVENAGEGLASRLLREAEVLRRLRHPNIVSVHDAGVHEGNAFVVMEYLAGGNLQRRLQEGVPLAEVRGIVRDIGAALDHAHGNGVLHCDVKPENILFRAAPGTGARSPALLGDFGIARIVRESAAEAPLQASAPYASPEQLAGRELDHRTDYIAWARCCI